jgi:multimeric flavodoxin WrbA
MKVIGFNGSTQKDGNTAILIRYAFKELEKEGFSCRLEQLSGKNIRDCTACYRCKDNKNQRCAVKADILNSYLEMMIEADGIILGSPSYIGDISSNLKSLIDRAGMVAKVNDDLFKRKIGVAIVAARRAGSLNVFDSINHFFLLGQMIVPGSSYWNIGFGRDKGDVENDWEGLRTMETLGKNMAWLIKKIND